MRQLQVPVTAAFFRELKSWVAKGDTTLKEFVPVVLAIAIGVHPVTGKPLPRAKGGAA